MNCPTCGHPLHGLATRCWAGGEGCGWGDPSREAALLNLPTRSTTGPGGRAPDSEPRRITIPWAELVSVNKRSGGMVGWTSKEWHASLKAMRKTVEVQAVAHRWPVLDGPVCVDIEYYVPDNRRRDCSNLDKGAIDALIGSVLNDDDQVVEWHGSKMPVHANPRAVVTVTAIAEEQAA